MTTEFKFQSESGESFTVISFSGIECISKLYKFEIDLKAPSTRGIDIHDILDDPVTFIAIEDGIEYPVHGVLASLEEIKTVQGYVYYHALLVPRLWKLSIYKTNEVYTTEKTVDLIVQSVLENAGLQSDVDFDLAQLNKSNFLERDYVCQFGESDFDFISRLLENEGIFYYFDHSGDQEKIIFGNDEYYPPIDKPDMVFETHSSPGNKYQQINAMSCRVQRLPGSVSVRDFNPDQPSLDIADSMTVDEMGIGTEYLYGCNIRDESEAAHITEIRSQELQCHKTRFYGESTGSRFRSGHSFALDNHPNSIYNGQEYLLVEINHHGANLDLVQSGESSKHQSTYQNSFVAIESTVQYRPPVITSKPRFYGTMTAFIYAEVGSNETEVDAQGRYRVVLPFDRAEGGKESTDPDRKASTWIRMAQPYVGIEQGMYFPLKGGNEVLLTFINGDPDRPIISGALANLSEPSLLTNESNDRSIISTPGNMHIEARAGQRTVMRIKES